MRPALDIAIYSRPHALNDIRGLDGFQSWELALYFQVPSSLSAHFISMDRYRSSAHLANFQVHSSLYRSQKKQWLALGKER